MCGRLTGRIMKPVSLQTKVCPHTGAAALPPTRWSVVARAGDRSLDVWVRDLETLVRLYRPVLVRHLVSHFRLSPDRAEDTVQAFLVEKVLVQNVVRQATPQRGRFRSFILTVLDHFATSRLRAQGALKRRVTERDVARLDDLPDMPQGGASVSDAFDALWARQVLARALALMREECARTKERQILWDLLAARTLGPVLDNAAPLPYDALVARFGLRSPAEASNLLVTAKRMFARTLRRVVRETVSDGREVESEIQELKRILSK